VYKKRSAIRDNNKIIINNDNGRNNNCYDYGNSSGIDCNMINYTNGNCNTTIK